ncbi:lipid A biosynthesis acyltransferase [Marinomonas agarivorans]|nr:lipid A biosynthesis acyltransferase [Marinomonas agarivorans]
MANTKHNKKDSFRSLLKPSLWPSWAFMGVAWLIGQLPWKIQQTTGRAFGRFLYHVAPRRLSICMTNLAICYPEMSEKERKQLAKKHFQSIGVGFFEAFTSWFHTADQLTMDVEFDSQQVIDDALALGRGCIYIGGHFSSIDICGNLMSRYNNVHPIYKKQKNPVFNYIMERQRERIFEKHIERSNMREVARSLKDNKTIWYAVDQDYGRDKSVFAPFFNRECSTIAHIGRIASITNAPVLLYDYGRTETGYKMSLTRLENFPTGDDVENAIIMNKCMEELVNSKKEQYYWTHRRFKTQKNPEDPSPY